MWGTKHGLENVMTDPLYSMVYSKEPEKDMIIAGSYFRR
jgi:hypothetical protein